MLKSHVWVQGRSSFKRHCIDVEGTNEEKAGKIVLRMLLSRYDRTQYILLLASMIYNSATRIQSTFRGHVARTLLSPRFRSKSLKSPPPAAAPPPASAIPEKIESLPKLAAVLKSAPSRPETPSCERLEDNSLPSRLAAEESVAPRQKPKICAPVWLLQVVIGHVGVTTLMTMVTVVRIYFHTFSNTHFSLSILDLSPLFLPHSCPL
jgi:hypothetical protein